MSILKETLVALLFVLVVCPLANAQTSKFEGVVAIAAGSIDSPNPIEGCSRAKRDAEAKAAKAGSIGLVSWDRLSNDSDCSLTTQGARGAGYVYIFTARGNFKK
ncbi:MAG TPA: hypothetical protein VK165_20315 [Azonexus sp.]|nr:hypothetical protein [Azonexus sp.]